MRRSRLGFAVGLIVVVLGSRAWAQDTGTADVVALGKKATALVEVTGRGAEEGGSGTAFCIDKSGLFITNAHVVEDAEMGKADIRVVLEPGPNQKRQILRARITRSDERLDLALLRVDPVPGLVPLQFGRDDRLTETMPVTTFGYPFGPVLRFRRNGYPDITVLESKITSLRRDEGQLRKIQFDNQLNPGNSGGPVLGPDGKVVGVAQATVKGSAMNFAIPVGLLQAFLNAPAILFNPPALAYKNRADKVTWTIKVQPPTASAPLPNGLSVSVRVATDVTPPRGFAAKPTGNGTYQVTLTPVPPETESPVELRVQVGGTWFETSVPDRSVRVGRASLLLSDLRQLMGGNPPRVITRKHEVVVGPILNLGKAKARVGRRGKQVTVDLSQADVIQVTSQASAKPLRAIEAVVELKQGNEVLATKSRRLEFPDAPILLIDRASGTGMLIRPQAPPVMSAPAVAPIFDVETKDVVMIVGGPLRADGVRRDAGREIKPPTVPMGDAILEGAANPSREEPLVRRLDAKLNNLEVGGGGRYLILQHRSTRQLAIFDVASAEIVKRIDLPSEEVLYTAGAEKLILLYPNEKLIQRYNLKSMTAESTAQKQPIQARIQNIVMGCDSDGPILAYWSDARGAGPFPSGPSRCSFIDPVTLKVLKMERQGSAADADPTAVRSFRLQHSTVQDRIQLRASPDGALFGSWCTSTGPSGIQIIAVRGGSIEGHYLHEDAGHIVPAADGKTLCTGYRGRRRSDGTDFDPKHRTGPSAETLVPSASPAYYLSISGFNDTHAPSQGPFSLTVRLASNDSDVITIRDLAEMAGSSRRPQSDQDGMTIDKRFHFIPQANLLITIPPSNDRLVLRRLDLDRAIENSPRPLLFVGSPSEISARPRQKLVHQVVARSSGGTVRYELTSGPAGLSVTPDGTLSWNVPLDGGGKSFEVILTVSDSSGRQLFHTIHLKID
jgi:S1-C subfamily serine protease